MTPKFLLQFDPFHTLRIHFMGTTEAVSHKHLDYYLDEFTFRFNLVAKHKRLVTHPHSPQARA